MAQTTLPRNGPIDQVKSKKTLTEPQKGARPKNKKEWQEDEKHRLNFQYLHSWRMSAGDGVNQKRKKKMFSIAVSKISQTLWIVFRL